MVSIVSITTCRLYAQTLENLLVRFIYHQQDQMLGLAFDQWFHTRKARHHLGLVALLGQVNQTRG